MPDFLFSYLFCKMKMQFAHCKYSSFRFFENCFYSKVSGFPDFRHMPFLFGRYTKERNLISFGKDVCFEAWLERYFISFVGPNDTTCAMVAYGLKFCTSDAKVIRDCSLEFSEIIR